MGCCIIFSYGFVSFESCLLYTWPSPMTSLYSLHRRQMRLFRWSRALELAMQHKTHVDTVLGYRQKYLRRSGKEETDKRFLQLAAEVVAEWVLCGPERYCASRLPDSKQTMMLRWCRGSGALSELARICCKAMSEDCGDVVLRMRYSIQRA